VDYNLSRSFFVVVLLWSMIVFCYPEIVSIANEYSVHCLDVSVGQVRSCIWQTFADSVV